MDILLKMQDVTLYMLSIKQYKCSYTWCIVYLNILFFFCYNVFSNTQFSVKRLYKSLILIFRKQIISFIHFTSLFAYNVFNSPFSSAKRKATIKPTIIAKASTEDAVMMITVLLKTNETISKIQSV